MITQQQFTETVWYQEDCFGVSFESIQVKRKYTYFKFTKPRNNFRVLRWSRLETEIYNCMKRNDHEWCDWYLYAFNMWDYSF